MYTRIVEVIWPFDQSDMEWFMWTKIIILAVTKHLRKTACLVLGFVSPRNRSETKMWLHQFHEEALSSDKMLDDVVVGRAS